MNNYLIKFDYNWLNTKLESNKPGSSTENPKCVNDKMYFKMVA